MNYYPSCQANLLAFSALGTLAGVMTRQAPLHPYTRVNISVVVTTELSQTIAIPR